MLSQPDLISLLGIAKTNEVMLRQIGNIMVRRVQAGYRAKPISPSNTWQTARHNSK
jgi:hypothetical protein